MAEVKIAADSGGGSVAIAGPASTTGNANLSYTLPDATTGGVIRTTTTPGGILQVVSTTKTDTFSSSTVDTFVDIDGTDQAGAGSVWCCKITPISTSNKILIFYDLQMSGTELFFIQLVRGSTAIKVGDSDSSNRVECTAGSIVQSGNNDKVQQIAGTFLDSPSTTSAITYKIQGRVYSSSKSFSVNKPINDSDSTYTGRGASTITLMEVAG